MVGNYEKCGVIYTNSTHEDRNLPSRLAKQKSNPCIHSCIISTSYTSSLKFVLVKRCSSREVKSKSTSLLVGISCIVSSRSTGSTGFAKMDERCGFSDSPIDALMLNLTLNLKGWPVSCAFVTKTTKDGMRNGMPSSFASLRFHSTPRPDLITPCIMAVLSI